MKCLIPVTQEYYPKNALKRAEKLCDEIILLYIVDKKMIEKVEAESSYILPSYSREGLEEFVINIHREEAEKLKDRIKNVPVVLNFRVGEYYETVDREVLRELPDLMMCDHYVRSFLNLKVPVWIDNGNDVKECTIIVQSLRKIERVKSGIKFAKEICARLNARFYIYYNGRDHEGIRALEPLGKITSDVRGELLIFLNGNLTTRVENKCLLFLKG